MATAAKVTIAEVEHLIDRIDSAEVMTPGIYVQRILQSERYERKLERLNCAKEQCPEDS